MWLGSTTLPIVSNVAPFVDLTYSIFSIFKIL